MFSFLLLLTFLISCTSEPSNKHDKWLGDYQYTEQIQVSFNGQTMPVDWSLSVHRINKLYKAILNKGSINSFSFECDLSGNNNELFVIYKSSFSGNVSDLKKGDTLLTLLKSNAIIRTIWGKVYSRLHPNVPIDCNCFRYMGSNKNNNTLITP